MPNYSLLAAPPTTGNSLAATPASRYTTPSFTQPNYGSVNPANNWAGSAQGKPNPATTTAAQMAGDYPIYDAGSASYLNIRTKKPWTGDLQDGRYSQNGRLSQKPAAAGPTIDPNNPAQRYQPVDIVKSPDVAAGEQTLMDQFRKSADQQLGDFNQYLSKFKDAASGAIDKANQANDVTDTVNQLKQAQSRYSGGLDQNTQNFADANSAANANEQGIVDQANAMLPGYNNAMTNAENLAQAQAQAAVSRYGAGKNAGAGANLGLGSDVANLALEKSYEAAQPYELAKVNRGYQILSDYALPVSRDVGARNAQFYGTYMPGAMGQQYQSAQGTASAVQNLKQAAANNDWNTAMHIMQIPEVAQQIRQQALSGDASLLSLLGQIEDQSRYRGLQDKIGVTPSQPAYYGLGGGAYPGPSSSRYGGPGSVSQPNLGPNAPMQVGGNGFNPSAMDEAYRMQTGYYPQQDPNFSQASYNSILAQFQGNQGSSGQGLARVSSGAQSGSRYDPVRGVYYDPATGQVTGLGPGASPSGSTADQGGDYNMNPALAGLA